MDGAWQLGPGAWGLGTLAWAQVSAPWMLYAVWALLGLAVSALTYVGAAAGLWACASGMVSFRNLVIMQFANTFAATTTPAGVGGLALSTRFLQKAGLGTSAHSTIIW